MSPKHNFQLLKFVVPFFHKIVFGLLLRIFIFYSFIFHLNTPFFICHLSHKMCFHILYYSWDFFFEKKQSVCFFLDFLGFPIFPMISFLVRFVILICCCYSDFSDFLQIFIKSLPFFNFLKSSGKDRTLKFQSEFHTLISFL